MTPRLALRRLARSLLTVIILLAGVSAAVGCAAGDAHHDSGALRVATTATFLADIAQNVAGDRFVVDSLAPPGSDLHAFEPTPRDVAAVSRSDLFILNGGGLEGPLEDTLRSAATDATFVTAAEGLVPREPQPGEPSDGHETDPHFWLDPTRVVTYVENIRDAFVAADPGGAAEYRANAEAYIEQLEALDTWIEAQVSTVPERDRALIMSHVSHGYFADRYGLRIVGALVPSVATGEAPSARHLTDLTETIRSEGVRAVFVELGESPRLARQIAAETGVAVLDGLRSHSLSGPEGEAPTYVDMMRYDTRLIVEGLK